MVKALRFKINVRFDLVLKPLMDDHVHGVLNSSVETQRGASAPLCILYISI
jgi:hypothetical protein